MRFVGFVLVLLSLSPLPAFALVQWTGTGSNNHWYDVSPTQSDWLTAKSFAESQGGTLATITSADEQSFIQSTFLTGPYANLPLWIGLSDAAAEGSFQWVTGEPLAYTNWNTATGEPNDYHDNGQVIGEDYVSINWHRAQNGGAQGTWNDVPVHGTGPVNGAGYVSFGGTSDGPYFAIIEYPHLPGDANLNDRIDPDDFALFDRGLAKHLSGFSNGDFNNDTLVNSADYSLLLSSFSILGYSPASPEFTPPAIPLPEPSLLTLSILLFLASPPRTPSLPKSRQDFP